MRLKGPDFIATLVMWTEHKSGAKICLNSPRQIHLAHENLSSADTLSWLGLGRLDPHCSSARGRWVMWASHLCSVWLIGDTWITLQFSVPGSPDASQPLGFLPSHSWALYRRILHNRDSGGSVKSEANPDVGASPSLSYKPDTSADRSFTHAQFYAHQACSYTSTGINGFLLAKKEGHVWWNAAGAGEAPLSQRPEPCELITHGEYSLTFVSTLPCLGSSWTTTQPMYLNGGSPVCARLGFALVFRCLVKI